MSKFLSWMRLARISALPTAWSNIIMGYLMAQACGPDAELAIRPLELGLLLLASSCLYVAGMVLNDVFDLEADRLTRPERVLPSGRIGVVAARRAGGWLLAGGVGFALLAGWHVGGGLDSLFRTPVFPVAVVLATFVVAYDAGGKRYWFGPLLMGGCRMLNVLLGASLGNDAPVLAGQDLTHWYVALCIGGFVAGITWFARREHTGGARGPLIGGGLLMAVAVAGLMFLPYSTGIWPGMEFRPGAVQRQLYCLLLAVVLFPAARRVLMAIGNPEASRIRQAVVACLGSLIMIDATLVYLFVPDRAWLAVSVALLIVPATLVGRRIRMT